MLVYLYGCMLVCYMPRHAMPAIIFYLLRLYCVLVRLPDTFDCILGMGLGRVAARGTSDSLVIYNASVFIIVIL